MKLPIKYDECDFKTRREARLLYIEQQNGLCWYCKQPLDGKPINKVDKANINMVLFPSKFFEYPIHLHHSRNNGMSLGAVHAKCNAYLWQYNHK